MSAQLLVSFAMLLEHSCPLHIPIKSVFKLLHQQHCQFALPLLSVFGSAGLKFGLSHGVSPQMFVVLLLTHHRLVVFSLIDWIADTHPQGDTDVQSLVKCPGLIVLWHASRMTAALCASVQNYTDDAMPENDCIMACV